MAVRLPRSPPLKVLAEQLRHDAEGILGAWRLSRAAAGREPLELAAVGMQGTVVMADRGEALLRDPRCPAGGPASAQVMPGPHRGPSSLLSAEELPRPDSSRPFPVLTLERGRGAAALEYLRASAPAVPAWEPLLRSLLRQVSVEQVLHISPPCAALGCNQDPHKACWEIGSEHVSQRITDPRGAVRMYKLIRLAVCAFLVELLFPSPGWNVLGLVLLFLGLQFYFCGFQH
ncbi:hypothetical protein P7K49_023035 [Saguinus oedipus]|uniref:Uncharacterized protein n=1 Tax=Saguinus oedipus TaxID=9490 RepID=A0ABQ9ULA5_SAGOE|nr:hypothetical protein P7K49_023035 [Saguinus oedipus]